MNRRQFIKSAFIAADAFIFKPVNLLRGGTIEEMPVSLGNRSVFAALWDEQGIKAEDVRARVDDLALQLKDPTDAEPFIQDLDWMNCAACQHQRDRLVVYRSHAICDKDDMERILAVNPEMSHEDAFFQAVMRVAEREL